MHSERAIELCLQLASEWLGTLSKGEADSIAFEVRKAKLLSPLGILHIDHAPIPNGHTSYALLRGEEFGMVIVLPECNFLLTTPEHQADLRQELAELGLELVLEEENPTIAD